MTFLVYLILIQPLIKATEAEAQAEVPRRDLAKFPACIEDDDCEKVSEQQEADFKCFQYMCFPWDNQTLANGFQSCRKSKDCQTEENTCFRHWDRKHVHRGVCLHKSETVACSEHDTCSPGLLCVNGHCGDPA